MSNIEWGQIDPKGHRRVKEDRCEHVLIACPFFRLCSGLLVGLGTLVDLSRAHTLLSSLCPSSPISSVSLETNDERVGPPAAQSNLTFGWPPFKRRENTPTPSLLQQTEIDGGMEGATKQKQKRKGIQADVFPYI